MTAEEIADLLTKLEELLRSSNLGFVVDQEQVLAAEGVTKSGAELDRGSSSGLWELSHRSGSQRKYRSDDVQTVQLDVRARLALLLDLVEVTTAGTQAIERSVQREFGQVSGTVTFEVPADRSSRQEKLVSWVLETDADSAAHAREVGSLVSSLRALAGVPRGEWLAGLAVDDVRTSAEEDL